MVELSFRNEEVAVPNPVGYGAGRDRSGQCRGVLQRVRRAAHAVNETFLQKNATAETILARSRSDRNFLSRIGYHMQKDRLFRPQWVRPFFLKNSADSSSSVLCAESEGCRRLEKTCSVEAMEKESFLSDQAENCALLPLTAGDASRMLGVLRHSRAFEPENERVLVARQA